MRNKISNFRNHRKKKHIQIRNLITIKRSNKVVEALNLPKIININPRSAMNKLDELETFIKEESIDCAFISESHDRENKKLEENIKLEDYEVISNIHQRIGKGGRPALIVNKKHYEVQNLTNTVIDIPWGVEVVWGLMTPKNVSNDCVVQKIVVGCIYCKPNSKKKSELLDHIASTYNFLSTKYGKGTYWLLAGDTNDLKLDNIINLSPNMRSMVKKPTRLNPDNILDNILTDMAKWYQEPDCLPPLAADEGSGGKPSDHLTVIMVPIDVLNNKPGRTKRQVLVRPIKQSSIDSFGFWIKQTDWKDIFDAKTVDEKTELFQSKLVEKVDEFFPQKNRVISSDDQPFCTEEMKRLKRLKSREYSKNRKSLKWRDLSKQYEKAVKKAKRNFVKDLKQSNIGQWYSKLKRLSSFDQQKTSL